MSPVGTLPTMRVAHVPELCRRILHLCPTIVASRFKALGPSWNTANDEVWRTFLNYVGGSYIYVRRELASRFKGLEPSWSTANIRVGARA